MSDPVTEELIRIVEQGMEAALRKSGADLLARIKQTEDLRAEHRARNRQIEAAACSIRLQALQEALAVLRGNALEPLRAYVTAGRHSGKLW